MSQKHIQKSIDEASRVIGKTWPLYSFVTSNPLSGYENLPFKEAVVKASELLKLKIYPTAALYRKAWEQGEIYENELLSLLDENGLKESPEFYLNQMESETTSHGKNENHDLDRIMAKWLSVFLDEGLAEWEMPNKKDGFYGAWRKLAHYDDELGLEKFNEIPTTSSEAISSVLSGYEIKNYTAILTYHLAALPGWTGYINYRTESNSAWQQVYPISLEDYLGVRLFIASKIKARIVAVDGTTNQNVAKIEIKHLWLMAWERSWQDRFITSIGQETVTIYKDGPTTPDAQLVFCIDTRSEPMRRHVEATGNYETFGYAGFFGIAMDYKNPDTGLTRKSCPPIVSSAYEVAEIPRTNKTNNFSTHQRKNENFRFAEYFLKRMKNMLPSAFGYVEGSGFFYGLSLVARTILPGISYNLKQKNTTSYETLCEPVLNNTDTSETFTAISLEERVSIVKSAFDLTGWNEFAPLILFVGHASHSANNAFGSSLDCGACAASPGRHNARMLAKLANLPEVRKALQEMHNLYIPSDTFFIGTEHNTTTDEIVIFDVDIPDSHVERLQQLKSNLLKVQLSATQDRLGIKNNSIALAEYKANDWGETRPEWGLAKNAGLIVGPRTLTKNLNLDGQCFLHSYDYEKDSTGQALEGIMQGPMVVTQWINNHYYFSTVDTDGFGGGSKITHNITGRFGVVQGNGGDLKMGLPLQSLCSADDEMYHRPLRLSVFIQAPISKVEDIISRNENIQNLLDNEWIHLLVIDPLNNNVISRYLKDLKWVSLSTTSTVASTSKQNQEVNNLKYIQV